MNSIEPKLAQRIFLVLVVTLMVACAWLAPFESNAKQQVDAGMKRALISFASARALNAAISVAQGTEIAIQPFGIGTTLALGQALDPVNDLVEHFSNLMLAAAMAFGAEKILISIGAHWFVSLVLTVTAIVWAYFYVRQYPSPPLIHRLLIVLLMVRFAMPVAIIGSDLLFKHFMEADYETSQQAIASISSQLDTAPPPIATATEDKGMLDRMKGWTTQQSTDLKSRFTALKQSAEQAVERIIKIMVIFLLQTLILPLFMLWAFWGLAKGSFETPPITHRVLAPRNRTKD